MAATALIQLTQGANIGVAGQALFGTTGTSVAVSNNDNTSIVSWQIDILYAPPGSSLSVGTLAFNNNSSTPSASFTPDVRGPYRIALYVWNAPNRSGTPTDTDIRNFGIKQANGIFRPAPQIWPRPLPPVVSGEAGAKPDENNFGGQGNGWSGSGSDGLLDNALSRIDAAIQVGAGTQTGTSGPIIFSDSNGISFGMSGSTRITASYTVPSLVGLLTGINISGGTASNNLSAFVFSNSNNVSFGLNGSTITASITAPTQSVQTQNVVIPSAGTQTATSGTLIFANSNGMSFGMSGSSQITASYTVPIITNSSATISAGTTSGTLSNLVFSNSNGMSFGLNNGTITGSYTVPNVPAQTVQTQNIVIPAGSNTTYTSGTVVFTGSNAVTVRSTTGQAIVIDVPIQSAQTQSNVQGISAGTQVGRTGDIIFSNSNGMTFGMSNSSVITGSYTVPNTAGLISNINLSAGTTSNNGTNFVFSNSNNVSFGLNGSTITASATVAQSAQTQNIVVPSAGTQTATSGTVVFSNSNNVTFGMSGSSQITASIPAGATATGNLGAIAAGTQTATSGTIVYANSNGVTFGMSGSSQVTASIATSLTNVNISAGTTSNNLSAFVFSNSNNVSFGLNGSTITASASYSQSTAPAAISAGTTQATNGTVVFSNSNGISFGMNNGTITATVNPGAAAGIAAIQGGTQTATSGTVIFANSNGVTFGMSGSTQMTVSVASSLTNVNFSAGTTSNNLSAAVFSNSNNVSFGLNGSTITASIATSLTNINFSAGTTSNNLSAIIFSNSNNVSFGLNGSTVTATISVPAQSNQTEGRYAIGNTTGQSSSSTFDARTMSFSGAGIASVGYSGNALIISVSAAQTVQTQNIVVPSAGTQTATSGTAVFANSNGMTFGMSGSSQITASYTVPNIAGLISAVNFSAGTTSNTLSAVTFSNSNGISFGLNGSTITGSVATSLTNINVSGGTTSNNLSAIVFSNSNNVSFGLNGSTLTATITVPAQTNQTAGLYAVGNTTGQSSSSTFDARTMSFSGAGIASVGYSGGNIIISVPAAGASINFSAGTTSNNLNAITFSNSNNVSFGLNGSTLTGSIATSLTNINLSAGTTSNNLSAFVFSNSNNVSFGLNGSTVTATITVPAQTNQTVGLFGLGNTTQSSSTTLDARSLSFNGLGIVTIGYSNGSIQISASSPQTVQTQNIVVPSAGTQTATSGTVVFANSNGISFGMSGSSQITATYTVPTQSNQTLGLFALGNTTQNSSTTLDARSLSFNGLGAATVGYSNSSIQISVPVQTAQTQSNIQAIYDGANSISTGTIRFTNANGVSFTINGQTISGSVAAQSNQSVGLFALGNTTQNSSTTLDARSLSFNGLGAATIGYSNGSIQISVPNALTNINISAGTTSNNLTAVTFSNSNNVSFGLNGSTLTASIATSLTNINFSAGTTSNNLSALVFSNSNGVSFGLNGSTVTGSIASSLTGVNLSAGTTSNNLSAFVFSNSNNVSFGLNGSTVTATITVPAQTVQTLGLFAIGNTTQSSSSTFDARTLSFNGLGGNTVGYSNGSIQISGVTTNNLISAVNFSAGTTSTNATAIIFSNSNNFTFGLNGNTITASFNGANAGIGAVSAGTQSKTSGTLIFSNSNNITFGMSGSNTITASYSQSNQTIGFFAVGNTTQNSSTTLDARTLSFNGLGAISVGYSNGTIQISGPASSSISATGALSLSVSSDTISLGVPVRNVSHLMWPEVPWGTNFSISNASFSIQHFNPKADITVSQANLLMALAGNTNSSGALTISMGIYTMSGSTMSLASSDSRALTWTSGSQTSASSLYGGISGTRYRTVSLANWNVSAGDYMLGFWFRTTNDGTWRAFGIQGPTIVGAIDANETNQYLNGFSTSSFTTAMVASINVTATNYVRTGGNALQQPSVIFLGSF